MPHTTSCQERVPSQGAILVHRKHLVSFARPPAPTTLLQPMTSAACHGQYCRVCLKLHPPTQSELICSELLPEEQMSYSVQKRPHVACGRYCGDPLHPSMTYLGCPEVITLSDCVCFSAENVQHLVGNSLPENCSKVMGPFDARFCHDGARDRAHVIKQDPPAFSKQVHAVGVKTAGVTGGLWHNTAVNAGQGQQSS